MTKSQLLIRLFFRVPIALCLLVYAGLANAGLTCLEAQQCVQSIELKPGWNSIYLKVTPVDSAVSSVMADFIDGDGPQIKSVWTFIQQRANFDYITSINLNRLLSQPGWLRYFHPDNDEAFLNNLGSVSANRAYLIYLDSESPLPLVVTGTPVVSRQPWQANSLSHTGFHIDEQQPPTFGQYFENSPAHQNFRAYRLDNTSGDWEALEEQQQIDADTAYWVFSDGRSTYHGPIQFVKGADLNFSFSSASRRMQLHSNTPESLNIEISLVNEQQSIITYRNPNLLDSITQLAFPTTFQIEVGRDLRLSIGASREQIGLTTFKDVMEVVVPGMSRWLIPINVEPARQAQQTTPSGSSSWFARLLEWAVPSAYAQLQDTNQGLWVGTVSITHVNEVNTYDFSCFSARAEGVDIEIYEPAGGTASEIENYQKLKTAIENSSVYIGLNPDDFPKPTSVDSNRLCTDPNNIGEPVFLAGDQGLTAVETPFQFRILLHSGLDQVHLLKDVIMMAEAKADGTTDSVLLVDDSLISEFAGLKLRDGKPVGLRLSTPVFDFDGNALAFTSGDLIAGSTLQATINQPPDSPTNPFYHRYHNEHDNLNNQFDGPSSIDESYQIGRSIEVELTTSNSGAAGGATAISGIYRETVTGLHARQISSSGTLQIQKISSYAVLEGLQ